MAEVELTHEEFYRYSRHIILSDMGIAGQKRLKQGSVLIIGTGGLGSPLSLYLAAAGVGHIGLVDFDAVDASNLQRQIVHGSATVGVPKTESARRRLEDLNPLVEVTTYETLISSENAMDIMRPYDVVVDATDNFQTRYLTNDACVLLGKPNVYGSIYGFEGQSTVFFPKQEGPCYRCLYPEPPPPGLVPSCADAGVLGIVPGVIGTIQATEVVKLLTGIGEPLIGRLLLYDALGMTFRTMKLRKNPECPICGETPTINELIDYEAFCGISHDGETLESHHQITPHELATLLNQDGPEGANARPYLLDVRNHYEAEIGSIAGTNQRIPINVLSEHLDDLDHSHDIVVYCKVGVRSALAVNMLRGAGFSRVRNLIGGIVRWSEEIDPSIPKY
jgi:adenylyltransferase/sulfurtransferase